MVKAGDLLSDRSAVPTAATYDSAVAQLEPRRASAKLAESQYKRAETLVKTSASRSRPTTRAALRWTDQRDMDVAEAVLATAKLNLDSPRCVRDCGQSQPRRY